MSQRGGPSRGGLSRAPIDEVRSTYTGHSAASRAATPAASEVVFWNLGQRSNGGSVSSHAAAQPRMRTPTPHPNALFMRSASCPAFIQGQDSLLETAGQASLLAGQAKLENTLLRAFQTACNKAAKPSGYTTQSRVTYLNHKSRGLDLNQRSMPERCRQMVTHASAPKVRGVS